jgi:hypothetical protein
LVLEEYFLSNPHGSDVTDSEIVLEIPPIEVFLTHTVQM